MRPAHVEAPLPTPRAVSLIVRGVVLETLRRKDFYVLLLLMGLFALGVLVVGLVGIENAATATFLLNLGLSFAAIAAHILVLTTAARQIPNELETRSIYPLLAKPLGRGQYVLGKWAAVTSAGIVALLVLLAIAWLPVPRMESFDGSLFAQAIALQALSLAMTAALALALSLVLPKGVALVVVGIFYLAGERLAEFLRSMAEGARLVDWLACYIPNFNLLNLVTRYTDGMGPLGPAEFVGLVAYGALWSVLALSLAAVAFRRRPL